MHPTDSVGAVPDVETRLLGAFQVLVGGVGRRIGARKQRALVAALALRTGARSRDSLVADLWPDSDEARGRQSLRHALYEINAAVRAELVATSADELRIADSVAVDVRDLERAVASGTDDDLRRAIALYRGDLCPEIEGVDGEAERVRLRGLFASAGEALAARRLEANPREAETITRRVIEIDPYREEAHRILLRALARGGDLASAAIHYKRLTALLREELGVEPSAETKRVYASLGRGAVTPRAAVRRPSLEPPAELIGRRAEYGALMTIVSRAIDGRGGASLVIGEAGAGKSRLLEEIGGVAERHGMRVLRARATSAEGALPFQLWIDAIAPAAADAAALPAPWPAVLATLLPEAARGSAGGVAPELRRTRLFEGVARLLAHVAASAPAVLVLDDLHNADPDSVQLFHYVARTSHQRRIAMVAAARPLTSRSALDEARVSLATRGDLAVTELGPLAPAAVGELLVRFGVPSDAPWLAPRVATWTGGNPFFVLEVLRTLVAQERLRREGEEWKWSGPRPAPDAPLAADLPPTVRESILMRIGALPDPTRRLLDLIAVVGPPTRLETIGTVAGRDELAIAEDLAPAFDAGLVRDLREGNAGSLAFAHDLVRDATYQRIPLAVRAAIHRRVAAALAQGGGTSRAIAFHLTAGGETVRAAEYWLASTREAEARFAHDDAIRGLEAALQALGPSSSRRAEILTSIGDAHMRRGTAAAAVEAYDDALAELAPDAHEDRAALQVRIAAAARYYHRHPRALEHAEAAVAHYRQRRDDAHLIDALIALAWVRYHDGAAANALNVAEEARLMARSIGDPRGEVRALHLALWSRWLAGDASANIGPADVDRLVGALGDDEAASLLLSIESNALRRAGRTAEAAAPARLALEMARRTGSLRAQLEAGEQLVESLRITGASREAIAVADQVRADVAGLDLDTPPQLLGSLVLALAVAGEDARTAELAGELIAARRGMPSPIHLSPATMAAGALMTIGSVPVRTVVEADRPSCVTCERNWMVVAARHAALSGDPERALALADEVASATTGTSLGAALAVPHIRAIAHARAGRSAAAERAAEDAHAGYRAAGRVDAALMLDRDLALISAVHA
jgi:DNA-binding SARP family transcriptional activator/tetratricopeptide (TPR) repeat protein